LSRGGSRGYIVSVPLRAILIATALLIVALVLEALTGGSVLAAAIAGLLLFVVL
jgi:hypothetical protein